MSENEKDLWSISALLAISLAGMAEIMLGEFYPQAGIAAAAVIAVAVGYILPRAAIRKKRREDKTGRN